MSDIKKQIIFPDDANFVPDEDQVQEQGELQGAVYFDEADFIPEGEEEKVTNKVTIYPQGIEIDLNDLEPVGEFNSLTGEIIFDEDEVEFIPDEPSSEPQEIKPAIVIDGPNPKI